MNKLTDEQVKVEVAKFEAWVVGRGGRIRCWENGRYHPDSTHTLWEGWNARAALAPPAIAGEPVAHTMLARQLATASNNILTGNAGLEDANACMEAATIIAATPIQSPPEAPAADGGKVLTPMTDEDMVTALDSAGVEIDPETAELLVRAVERWHGIDAATPPAADAGQAGSVRASDVVRHPLQPLVLDSQGRLRFKENKIVSHLLEVGRQSGCGLNELARMEFVQEDREQFAQLIGYSLDGWGTLSYVSDEAYAEAQAATAGATVMEDKKP